MTTRSGHKNHDTVCTPTNSHTDCGHAWSEHGERPDGTSACPTYSTVTRRRIMDRQELSDKVKQDFPINARVGIRYTKLNGTVVGHASYQMAFIGLTTFIVVQPDGHDLANEYAPSVLEKY